MRDARCPLPTVRTAFLFGVRPLSVVLIAIGLLAGLAHPAGAVTDRERDKGLISDSKYESPAFGYRVTWEDAWEAESRSTFSDTSYDLLTLGSWGATIEVMGVATDADLDEVLDLVRTNAAPTNEIPCDEIDTDWLAEWDLARRGEEDGVAFMLLVGSPNGIDGGWYVEAWEFADDEGERVVVVSSLLSSTGLLAQNTEFAAEEVEIEGEPILMAVASGNDEETDRGGAQDSRDEEDSRTDDSRDCQASGEPGPADDDENRGESGREQPDENGLIGEDAYRSPTYGFEVEWSCDWLADDAVVGDSSDQLYLENEDNTAQIWLTGLATDEDLDEVRDEFAFGFVSGVSEDSELLDRGESDGVYWATFSIEFEDSGTVIAYVEAREIEPAESGEPAIVTVTIFFAVEPLYDDLIEEAAERVELDGEPILLAYDAS